MNDPPKGFKEGRNTHHFALHINKDHTFAIYIDNEQVKNGSLSTDFTPPFFPPKEIPDISKYLFLLLFLLLLVFFIVSELTK